MNVPKNGTFFFTVQLSDKEKIKDGSTPVFAAASNGHVAAVEVLCEFNATVSKGQKGTYLSLNALIDAKDKITPLAIAARNGHIKCVEFLLSKGASAERADDDGNTPLHTAAERGDIPLIELLVSKNDSLLQQTNLDGATALYIACSEGHLATVEKLLALEANPNRCTFGTRRFFILHLVLFSFACRGTIAS